MTAATIKVFLPYGDAKRLRTAEISNWTGKALAAPRSELEGLLERPEMDKPGIYLLSGNAPETGEPTVYIGEAEIIRQRIRAHTNRDFWVHAIVFTSKDENLTKSHIRYLEGRLIEEAQQTGRVRLQNVQAGGSALPESDVADMEVFLARIRQLLPVLGLDMLTPIKKQKGERGEQVLLCEIKGVKGRGTRTPDGFIVYAGSQAVLEERPSAQKRHPYVVSLRRKLLEKGDLLQREGHLQFERDVEFSSPSAAASVIYGGGANGLTAWRTQEGKVLKSLEEA